MTFQEIEQFITQFPLYQYEFIQTKELEFSDKVRTICKKECPRYGNSWSCPPAVGTIESCKKKCMNYPEAIIFSSVAENVDYSNMNKMLKTRYEHETITKKIEKHLHAHEVPCYTLSTDSCGICEKCSYPKKKCLHPDAMHPCIESHGIVITNILEKYQMDYFMGENMILWFSIIFMKEI